MSLSCYSTTDRFFFLDEYIKIAIDASGINIYVLRKQENVFDLHDRTFDNETEIYASNISSCVL
jgi:hypothetical protein